MRIKQNSLILSIKALLLVSLCLGQSSFESRLAQAQELETTKSSMRLRSDMKPFIVINQRTMPWLVKLLDWLMV